MKLYDELKKYTRKNIVAMHMPGHKRKKYIKNKIPYHLDITEINGFDNLHSATGILKHCQEKITKLYGTKQSFYLVNGSTSGILASIKTICNIGDKIVIPANCHKSVYHAIELLNLNVAFIPLSVDENNIFKAIDPGDVEDVLNQNPDAKCVLITSPTYEGVMSDISSIAKIAHKHNIPLVVDEAHGAHLFLEKKSAINFGADIVINSLHKTLPSLTQTAVLHVCSKLIDTNKIKHNLGIFMSSSPSYILMASIDECVEFLIKNGKKYYEKLQNNLNYFINLSKNLKYLKLFNNDDKSKIVILTNNSSINGEALMQKLRQQKIELEMAYTNYALCYATMFDDKKSFKKLFSALKKIDNSLTQKDNIAIKQLCLPKVKTNITKALEKGGTLQSLTSTIGCVSKEYVWLYPPGVPILIPGQVITKQVFDYIMYAKNQGLEVKKTYDSDFDKIYIIKT